VAEGLDGDSRVLLDPNTLSEDGTVALTGRVVSNDAKLMAYGTSSGGSDWQEWHVRDVETGQDLEDHIRWVKFSGASWASDNSGFYYSRYAEPQDGEAMEGLNYNQKVYFHRVGTPQSEDQLVYERPDQKEWGFRATVSDDGQYLILNVRQGTDTRNRLFYQKLKGRGKGKVVELLNDFDASYSFLGNLGPVFYFRTDLNAKKGRIIAIDTRSPERENWKVIIPESEETLRGISFFNKQLVASYLKDAHSQVRVFDPEGKLLRDLELPGIGSAGGFGGKQDATETFYSFTSYTAPPSIYHYDLATGESTLHKRAEVAFNPDEYQTEQIFYNSKDGTRVPMFISYKRGLEKTGQNPAILYGYGGFNISQTPRFSVSNLVWMEMGGIYSVANLRGGGEYGEAWHQGGMKLKKQNVFDDFIAAGEWLIKNKYTSKQKLAIRGGSNGGLLVGACMNQRPDLFGVALPAVGVMDMLRFDKFTIGWAWVSDYGTSEDPEEFKALHAYSPYHNLKKDTAYPATLITTADHDDRVVPSHSFKFASALQVAHVGPNPVLIRIETRAGHGAGKPTSKRIREAADIMAFALNEMGE
jgi:prolyl oligopeptidase